MAQNTVVEYVLKVNAQGAQRALDKTGDEALDTSKDFQRLEKSTKQVSQSMGHMAKQTNASIKSARNFRRAGRDLDGALGDLAQGIGHVSPQLGHFLLSASDGVSIVEGLGRGMTLLLNPAVAAAATLALAAGGAMAFLDAKEEAAKEKAESLAKAIEDANKVIDEQSRIAEKARNSLSNYAQKVEQARTELQLLTGQTNEFRVAREQNNKSVEEFGRNTVQAQIDERKALEETAKQQDLKAQQLREQIDLLKEQRKITQTVRDEQRFGEKFARSTEEERTLRSQLKDVEAQRKETEQLTEQNRKNFDEIQKQKEELQETLREITRINEANARREEAEKRRAERLKRKQEQERKIEQQERARLKAQAQASEKRISAQQQINAIIEQTQRNTLSEREAIIASFQDQISEVRRLAQISGATNSAEVAIRALLEEKDKALFDLAVKQREQTEKELKQQDKKLAKQEEELSKVDRLVKLRQRILTLRGKEVDAQDAINRQQTAEGAVQTFQTLTSLDVASIIGLISPIAGAIAQALIALGEKTPEQMREEVEAQAKALASGLTILPELFLQILPELTLAIAEAINDGMIRLVINLVEIIKNAFKFLGSSRDVTTDGQRVGRGRAREFLRDFFDPNQSASYASGGRFLPSAQGGIRYTGMKDGMAMLHRGEFVVPQSGQRPQQVDRALNGIGGGVNININSAIVERSAVDSLVRQIEQRFNAKFGVSSSNLFGGR